jgi:ABC-type transport system involved in cytochrome bd biosynthesis fused ATPase/permease subunit
LKNSQSALLVSVSLLGLALVIADITLVLGNQARQTSINNRARYIQQSVQLQTLYQDIVKAIADLAVRNKDEPLRDLLARNGMTISVNTPGGAATATPAKGKP